MREFLTLPTIRRASPLRRNVRCVAFAASAALVTTMLAQGIRVRLNILDTSHYVAPIDDIGPDRMWELLQDDRFKWIATVTFLTASPGVSQNFTIPNSWNNANNAIDGIAGGAAGGGGHGTSPGGGFGGGGGEWRRVTNAVFLHGQIVSYTIGAGAPSVGDTQTGGNGGNTSFGIILVANGGTGGGTLEGGSPGVGGTGGTGGIGNPGGDGGGQFGVSPGGGGGAGGPNGAGQAGGTGTTGGAGDAGFGGAGGAINGGTGGNGAEYTATAGGTAGSGGGGGPGQRNANPGFGGAGGLYGGAGGGGGGGTSGTSNPSGAGAQGLIVVTNVPSTRVSFAGIIGL